MGIGFASSGDLPARLSEQVKPVAVLPLQAMYADLVRQHPGPPDSRVCGLHQSDCNPALGVSARPGVGLPPLFCEVDGYPFWGSHRLHTQ